MRVTPAILVYCLSRPSRRTSYAVGALSASLFVGVVTGGFGEPVSRFVQTTGLGGNGSGDQLSRSALGQDAIGSSSTELRSVDIPNDVLGLLKSHCYECHSGDIDEGNLSFDSWAMLEEAARDRKLEHIVKAIRLGEMPPEGAMPLKAEEKERILSWADATLDSIANRSANQPGEVVLRRLSNLEYNYTVRDLTGIPSLDPTREFPGDNAAGEGFTNAGAAMVMSPSLFSKYLDAAKEIAAHAVLTPTGAEFSSSTSRNDWATERLDRIRNLYAKYSNNRGAEAVNLQGVAFETNQGGRLPLELYFDALLKNWTGIRDGSKPIADVAQESQISSKYLQTLANVLTTKSDDSFLQQLQNKWDEALEKQSIESLVSWLSQWQKSLWKFSSVGHIGKLNGPKAWQEPVSPLASSVTLRAPVTAESHSLKISIRDAGDGREGDSVNLLNPRFVRSGESDISLLDAMSLDGRWKDFSDRLASSTTKALEVASKISKPLSRSEIEKYAQDNNLNTASLEFWLGQIGLTRDDAAIPSERHAKLLTQSVAKMGEHDGIQGWIDKNALSIIANAKNEVQRIPGWIAPKSVAVHPAPDQTVGLGLVVPTEGAASITALVEHVHTECGNGTAWSLEVVRSSCRIVLASGNSAGKQVVNIGPFPIVPLLAGDEVCLQVSPRDGNHACDMTRIDLTVEQDGKRWNAAESLSGRIHESNPLPAGENANWQFYTQPTNAWANSTVPANSLLARWWLAPTQEEKQTIALELQRLLLDSELHAKAPAADQQLIRSLASVKNYLRLSGTEQSKTPLTLQTSDGTVTVTGPMLSLGNVVWLSFPVPAALRGGWEFVADANLNSDGGTNGSVQLVAESKPQKEIEDADQKEASKPSKSLKQKAVLIPGVPILVHSESGSRQRLEASIDQFRQLFPIALCYHQIVPVDEVVTLTLYHREDAHLKSLMLTEAESAELDRLWEELHFVSRDAFQSVDAYEQLWQYATQDADPSAFEPLRQPLLDRAAEFSKKLLASESVHRDWLIKFAQKAYRRPLSESERSGYEDLYARLVSQGLDHEAAIRGCMARVLVSPEFLYRLESPKADSESSPVSATELATRLSYFLWASMPDDELLGLAQDGSLVEDNVLREQVQRMLKDPKAKRFARAFLGQWLQVANVRDLDEKSETVFPEFQSLRESAQLESDLFFEHLVQQNRPPMELLTADYTFLNQTMKEFYGIEPVEQAQPIVKAADVGASLENGNENVVKIDVVPEAFERFDGLKQHNRGGFMRHASVLAKNAGASRTSAILRGTWISEVLLGEHLPKPPKNVPPLPESVPENLSERQLIELHVNAPECSGCHKRIDPFGFAMENFDAIGRFRRVDTAERTIDSKTELPDGTPVSGHQELLDYLANIKQTQFLTQFHRKLLGYAIGREVSLSDRPMIQSLVNRSKNETHYGIWDAVEAVVLSRQFREIRGEEKE